MYYVYYRANEAHRLKKNILHVAFNLEYAIKQIGKLRIVYGYLILGALPNTIKIPVDGYLKFNWRK